MQHDLEKEIALLVAKHHEEIWDLDSRARNQTDHAYGGFLRVTKGKWVEDLTEGIIRLAWDKLGGDPN